MNILAIETSTKHFSLAIMKNSKIIAQKTLVLKDVLSSTIIPTIDGILKKSKLTLAKLDGFAIGLGPGSFTSLRVGLSTIKAFAMTTKKPVVGVSSLDILATNISEKNTFDICSMIDARRNSVYACVYRPKNKGLKRITKYLLCPVNDLKTHITTKTIFVGDGLSLYRDEIFQLFKERALFAKPGDWYPHAQQLAKLAYQRFQNKKFDTIETLKPLYLYPDHCQVGK